MQDRHGSRRPVCSSPPRSSSPPLRRARHRRHRGAGSGTGHEGRGGLQLGVAIGRRGVADLRDRGPRGPGAGLPRGVPGRSNMPAPPICSTSPTSSGRRPRSPQEVDGDGPAEHPAKLFLGGLAVTMGNPKVMVFYLALLPTFLDLPRSRCWAMRNWWWRPCGAGRGVRRLYRAGRPGPAALHQRARPSGSSTGAPAPSWRAPRQRSRRRGNASTALINSAVFGDFPPDFHARVRARG